MLRMPFTLPLELYLVLWERPTLTLAIGNWKRSGGKISTVWELVLKE